MFDTGDWIVIGITIIVVAIFRILDSNNRSLEKVKRFTDMIIGQLDDIVEKRKQELRDMAIEVDVHQNAAKDIIQHVTEVENSFRERAEEIEKMGQQVDTYDSVLKELYRMTAQVEENIRRIQDESAFTDKVAKNLKALTTQVHQLDEAIPRIIDDFRERNKKEMVQVRDEVFIETSNRVKGLGQEVITFSNTLQEIRDEINTHEDKTEHLLENNLNKLHEQEAQTEARLKQLMIEYNQRLSELAEQGEAMQHGAFAHLKEHLETTVRELKDSLGEKQKEIEEDLASDLFDLKSRNKERVEGLEGYLYKIEEDFTQKLSMADADSQKRADDTISAIENSILERSNKLANDLDVKLNNFYETAQLSRSRVEELFQNVKSEVDTWSTKMDTYLADLEKKVVVLNDSARDASSEQAEIINEYMEKTKARLFESEQALTDTISNFDKRITQTEEKFKIELDDVSSRGATMSEELLIRYRTDLEHVQDTFKPELENGLSQLQTQLKQAEEGIEARIQELLANTKNIDADIDSRLAGLEERYSQQLLDFEASTQEKFNSHIRSIDDILEEARSSAESINRSNTENRQQLEENQAMLNQELQGLQQNIENSMNQFYTDLSARTKGIENTITEDIEGRLNEYQESFIQKIASLETVTRDIDGLEGNLRDSMSIVEDRIREEFSVFGDEMKNLRGKERSYSDEHFSGIRQDISALESGLAELKQRAYDNVSEKLQIFEDDFFNDLRQRNSEMADKLSSWQAEIQARLTEMHEQELTERQDLESSFNKNLGQRLVDFEDTVKERLEAVNLSVNGYRDNIDAKMDQNNDLLNRVENDFKSSLSAFREETLTSISNQIEAQGREYESIIEKNSRELESRFDNLSSTLQNNTQEITDMFESSRSDVSKWQARVMQDIKGTEAEFNNQMADVKVSVSSSISELKAGFNEAKEQSLDQIRVETQNLHAELDSVSDTVANLSNRLETETSNAIAGFEKQYQDFVAGFNRTAGDIQTQTESQAKELRNLIQDTKDKFTAMEEKLVGRLESETNVLDVNLQEIEKKQKQFVEQTKIFERADSLKLALEQDIKALQDQVAFVDSQRQNLKALETQLNKLLTMNDENSDKIDRFFSEKKNIDNLEQDINRLMSLSQGVDQKLQALSQRDDKIQNLQLQLRNIDETQKELNSLVTRIEDKSEIIEGTHQGISKNFEQLQQLETVLEQVDVKVKDIPLELDIIGKRIDELVINRKDADTAISRLNELDTIVLDLENKMEGLQNAREWLAQTETRLQDLDKSSRDQLKLFAALVKDGATKRKTMEKGAPSMSNRETVKKLAHQGWNVDEICRATQLSRGEVELILELPVK